jgi:hypothetical protein
MVKAQSQMESKTSQLKELSHSDVKVSKLLDTQLVFPDKTQKDNSTILYQTIVKKRNFFYNQRQIVFYQDGSFSYSKKGDKAQKSKIKPCIIKCVERNNQSLTIYTHFKEQENQKQMTFKFAS